MASNTPYVKVAAPIQASVFIETPMTLTVGTETANVIPVVVAARPAVAQYLAQVYDASMVAGVVGAWRLAETGAGAEVSLTLKPALLFTTDANGAATLSITDVAGASGLSVYLKVSPAPVQGGTPSNGVAAVVPATFD